MSDPFSLSRFELAQDESGIYESSPKLGSSPPTDSGVAPAANGAIVRDASVADAAACAAIYAPYVTGTAITFETEPPPQARMATRIEAASKAYAWLVLEHGGRVVGYAYAGRFHARPAYRWAAEVSVYLEPGRRRTGGGRALYEALLARLRERGFRIAIAGMTLPNEASVALHESFGFEPVGVYRRIGYKLGRWHDVAWMQRRLIDDDGEPPEPR